MLALLKHIAPGSIDFLAVCCMIGLALARCGPRARRLARIWLLLVFSAYIVAGVPWVASAIAGRLPSYPPVSAARVGSSPMLIVLHGDNARGRIREARRLFDAVAPTVVLVSGGADFVEMIVQAGIPQEHIVTDARASNTREQMINAAAFVQSRGAGETVLIASRLQMPRVAALADALGWRVTFAPSPVDDEPPTSGLRLIIPTYVGLRVTRDALYEHLALWHYRRKRWLE